MVVLVSHCYNSLCISQTHKHSSVPNNSKPSGGDWLRLFFYVNITTNIYMSAYMNFIYKLKWKIYFYMTPLPEQCFLESKFRI